ncbi:membrane protein [Mangrovibacter sp. MFB070]|uniref:hypothetical protein n=1 Tax=Mangrovibacter sp. MFB070 TaxID=1224318 RepID=UPI0004D7AA71|nr:hypothetical protein [Mangrovibacter sp. MFB070]KEA50736.1 membrane protein [Mangrovibacter sp. MFB070]
MAFVSEREIVKKVFSKKIDFAILALFYISAIFFLLCSGVLFQYFTAGFTKGNCYECSMKLDYIKQFYFSKGTAWYLISAVAIFIGSVFIQHRIKGYLTLLALTWIALTITDVILIRALDDIAMNNILLNILYNLFGAILLSLYVCLSNSLIFHLNKVKNIPMILSAMLPLIAAIIIAVLITAVIYLLFARQAVEIEMDISEGSDIAYAGVKNNEESFGFLNDKKTDTPTYLDVMKNGSLIYNDIKGLSGADIYIVSGCYTLPNLLHNVPLDAKKSFLNVKKIEITQKFPMMGFIQGESADVIPKAASRLSLSKQDDEYMLASSVTDSQITFESNNAQLMVAFAFMPITTNGFLHDYTYDIIINNEKYKIENHIAPLSRLDKNKKMKCEYQQLSDLTNTYSINANYLTGFLIVIKPDDIINFNNSPSVVLKTDMAFYKKTYQKLDKIYDDISNGKLSALKATGISQFSINGKHLSLRPESEIVISEGSLYGLVNKSKKIKIYGTADLVFVDSKIMNLRKITYLQSKLEIFGSSVVDILKYIFGLGLLVISIKFIRSYFKNDVNENLFL